MTMKNVRKNILLSALVIMIGLTSCFEEKDDDYTIVGAVASIPVFTPSKSEPVAGEQITVNVRYYSEKAQVTEIRFTEKIGAGTATVLQTKSITGFDVKNSYTDSFTYTVPAVAVGTKIVLAAEVETVNDLMNSKSATITVK
jgi:hypothetical protein